MLASYPEIVLKYACDPVVGIPSRHKYLPSLSDLKLELEMAAATVQRDRDRAATPLLPRPEKRPQPLESEAERLARLDVEYRDCYWGPDEDIQPGDVVAGVRSKDGGVWKMRAMAPEEKASRPKLRYSDWYKARYSQAMPTNTNKSRQGIRTPPENETRTSAAELEEEPNPFL